MNILIIGGSGDSHLPNSVCIKNMTSEFVSKGNKVWILAGGNDYVNSPGILEGAELWQVPVDYYSKLTMSLSRNPTFLKRLWYSVFSVLRHVVLLFCFPTTNPIRSRKLLKKARMIVKDNNINLVIATFLYFENIYAGLQIKKQYQDKIKVVSYHLDLRTASASPNVYLRKYIRMRALHSMIKESRIVDKILVPYSGKNDVEDIKGIDLKKIKFIGFPVFIKGDYSNNCSLPFVDDAINISYMGSLSFDNRNPLPFLPLLEETSARIGKKIMIYFWGNCDGMESQINASPIASYQGIIDNKYASYIMENSDFLLNVGNKISFDMIPSKIFSMFATGKPIINLVLHPKDATVPYFKRYRHCINLDMYEMKGSEVSSLVKGVSKFYNTPIIDCEEEFNDFKPAYICDEILK